MLRKTLSLALGLGFFAATLTAAETYNFGGRDASHAQIGFKISHWVINKVHGTFDKFEGKIVYNEKNVEKSKVEVTIDAASINTRNEMRDKHLRGADFFNVEKNPTLTFKSTKVAKSDDGKSLVVTGDLTMNGVKKTVDLNVVIAGKMEDNQGNTRLGFDGSTKVKRTDFGIAWNKTNKTGTAMLGDEVEIDLSGEGTLVK